MRVYCGAKFPQKGAAKKFGLRELAIAVEAASKKMAGILIEAEFIKLFPEHAEYYFDVRVWEDRPGLPHPPHNQFCDDFFTSVASWDKQAGEPVPLPAESGVVDASGDAVPRHRQVKDLETPHRAAALTLFGPVPDIDEAQFGLVVDLDNDDERSYAGELKEMIQRTSCILSLEPKRQGELLAHIREKCNDTAQWTDMQKVAFKWMDKPASLRDVFIHSVSAVDQPGTTSNEGEKTEVTDHVEDFSHQNQPPAQRDDPEPQPVVPEAQLALPSVPPATLTYEQQLTIAALNGLCANPACFGTYEDLPGMAAWLAAGVVRRLEP
ncbi:hypothetical protein [Enterobacter hormaechei]|uniref:hypothetical protein n=1 Tax=Enterobacter hormaechei TaxID=158836 RepID=UPI002A75A3B2|nr:hypothetical protein [Enterobacter hormaechei]MDY3570232.1 hypothetical protein [Enterobacter hormaechei]